MEKIVSTAKVIDGTLILTLPDAIRPVVWQMQLGQTKSSALEVREQNNSWILYLKTPRMDVMEIAPFATKEAAVRALLAVSKAMEKAQGHFNAGSGYPVPAVIPACQRFGFLCRLMKTVGYILLSLLLVALILWSILWVLRPASFDPSQTNAAVSESGASGAATQTEIAPAGQAVPADEFLDSLPE